MTETVLITGGAGFVGSHLVERFIKQNIKVLCIDNFATGQKKNITPFEKHPYLFQFVQADVCEPWERWQKNMSDSTLSSVDRVFHFASPASPPHYQRLSLETMWVNTLGLQNALRFADAVGAHVTFASTSEIYGDPDISPQNESYFGNVNTWGPRSCYDESKRFGEALIHTWNEKFKTHHGCVRIFNTYGPRMDPADGRVIINFLVQAIQRRPLTIYGDGKQTRSFCFVDDLCAAIDQYSKLELSEPVNIGNDNEFTINELTTVIKKIFDDRELEVVHHDLPKDDPKQRRPDLGKARKMLTPWEPKIQLKEGLQTMRKWLEVEGLG